MLLGMTDVIVIGGGIMGLSAAVELGRRGQRVLLLEARRLGHRMGSSHGETRVIRTGYFEHPDYVPLAQRAWKLWGDDLVACGGLYLGLPDSELISGFLHAAQVHNLRYENLAGVEVRRRYPQVRLPDGYSCIYERDCGFVYAARAMQGLLSEASAHGVVIQTNEPVVKWEARAQSVVVATADNRYEAGALVICAGSWTGKLLAELDLPLVVTRQVVGMTEPPDLQAFAMDRLPVVCAEEPDGAFTYTIPINPDCGWFKAARHNMGAVADPDDPGREPTDADPETFLAGLRTFLPVALGPVKRIDVCLYTNSPDGHFILDRHPNHSNVTFACGFSGHGFKFAPVIGEALSDLALKGSTELPVHFLGLDRLNRAQSGRA